MQLLCPFCSRTLEFSDLHPSFCAFCGERLPADPNATASFHVDPDATVPEESAAIEEHPDAVPGYRLYRLLGVGGMGKVYEAEEFASGRRVAVKVIAPQFIASPAVVERFRLEGRLAGAIVHPRCVFVHAAEAAEGRPYIVMELMPGDTLKDLVERNGPLPSGEAVLKTLDVIEGLAEAHRLGILHRDVKPSNCFLEPNGRVKVGDFGLARSLVQHPELTRPGAFLGTPLFASPEQVRCEALTPQSDVYSTAATLFYLLTGQAPFQSNDAASTLARIVSERAPTLRRFRPGVSRALDRVVLRGLEKNRERRWRDLGQLREALLPFAPARRTAAELRSRAVALGIDWLLVELASHSITSGAAELGLRWEESLTSPLLWLVYFSVSEGLGSGSLGKRCLALRVIKNEESDAPGLGRGLARALSFSVLFGYWNAPLAAFVFADADLSTNVVAAFAVVAAFVSLPVLGLIAAALPMRERNGWRGLHEILSGTRVVPLDRPGRFQPLGASSVPNAQPAADAPSSAGKLPVQVGFFRVESEWFQGDGEHFLFGADASLQRRVLLRLRPRSAEPLHNAWRSIDRPTRLRWLAGGEQDDWQWDAFVAPSGSPLTAVVRGRSLTWAETRHLLEQLAEELEAAVADGVLPTRLTLEQVYVQPHGRLQLLDAAPGPEVPDPRGGQTPAAAAATFLGRAAVAALEGRSRPNGDSTPWVRVPLPAHAAKLLSPLLGAQATVGLGEFRAALAASRALPAEVTRGRYFAHLLLSALGLFLTTCCGAPWFTEAVWISTSEKRIEENQKILEWLDARAAAHVVGLTRDPWSGVSLASGWEDFLDRREELRSALVAARQRCSEYRRSRSFWIDRLGVQSGISRETDPAVALTDRAFMTQALQTVAALPYPSLLADLFVWSAVLWVAAHLCWMGLWRGGVSLRLTGLTLVQTDGRPAGRLRCLLRSGLFWLPVLFLFVGSVRLDSWYWTDWSPQVSAERIWALSLAGFLSEWMIPALFVGHAGLSLWSPGRSVVDRLAGTRLVPR